MDFLFYFQDASIIVSATGTAYGYDMDAPMLKGNTGRGDLSDWANERLPMDASI